MSQEIQLITYLACHPGWVLSAEQIYYAIWHDNLFGCEHVIYNTVKYSLQGTTQGRYLTGGVPPVRFSM